MLGSDSLFWFFVNLVGASLGAMIVYGAMALYRSKRKKRRVALRKKIVEAIAELMRESQEFTLVELAGKAGCSANDAWEDGRAALKLFVEKKMLAVRYSTPRRMSWEVVTRNVEHERQKVWGV